MEKRINLSSALGGGSGGGGGGGGDSGGYGGGGGGGGAANGSSGGSGGAEDDGHFQMEVRGSQNNNNPVFIVCGQGLSIGGGVLTGGRRAQLLKQTQPAFCFYQSVNHTPIQPTSLQPSHFFPT